MVSLFSPNGSTESKDYDRLARSIANGNEEYISRMRKDERFMQLTVDLLLDGAIVGRNGNYFNALKMIVRKRVEKAAEYIVSNPSSRGVAHKGELLRNEVVKKSLRAAQIALAQLDSFGERDRHGDTLHSASIGTIRKLQTYNGVGLRNVQLPESDGTRRLP